MKKCPFCAEEIQDAAVVCKHCGRNLKAVAAPTQLPPPKKKTGCLTWVVLGFFILLGIGFLGNLISGPPRPRTATSTSPTPAATPKAVDPLVADAEAVKQIEKRLAANREHLKKYYGTAGQVRQAAADETVLVKVKSSYVTGTTKEAKELSQAASRLLPQVEQQLREIYASSAEEILVKSGIGAKVSATGASKTRLRVVYALMSQPLVYKFQNEIKSDEQARQFGFTKLEYTNGFSSELGHTWTVDLEK